MWGSAPPVSAPSEAKHSHTAAGSSLQAKGGRGWKRFDSHLAMTPLLVQSQMRNPPTCFQFHRCRFHGIDRLVSRCPAVATLIHVLHEYFHNLVQSNLMRFRAGNLQPSSPKKSDSGDLMHLLYAPYMTIFRCDARFGEHLKSHIPVRSKIAARRADILPLL